MLNGECVGRVLKLMRTSHPRRVFRESLDALPRNPQQVTLRVSDGELECNSEQKFEAMETMIPRFETPEAALLPGKRALNLDEGGHHSEPTGYMRSFAFFLEKFA
jgi:hypothetical protein